jgi:hypothetical protein
MGWRGNLGGFFLVLKFCIFLAKAFNPARGVNEFLFTGKKWMAFGTYFNTDIGFGRANLEFISTCTSNIGIGIIRMDFLFHDTFNPLLNLICSFQPHSGRAPRAGHRSRKIGSSVIYSGKMHMSIEILKLPLN